MTPARPKPSRTSGPPPLASGTVVPWGVPSPGPVTSGPFPRDPSPYLAALFRPDKFSPDALAGRANARVTFAPGAFAESLRAVRAGRHAIDLVLENPLDGKRTFLASTADGTVRVHADAAGAHVALLRTEAGVRVHHALGKWSGVLTLAVAAAAVVTWQDADGGPDVLVGTAALSAIAVVPVISPPTDGRLVLQLARPGR